MSGPSFAENLFHGRLRAASGRLFWLGLLMVVLGLAAIVFPMIATLVATLLVGWVFLISGVTMVNNAGHIFAFLVITVAAAEAAIGLAIVAVTFRRSPRVDVDEVATLTG